MHTHIYKYTYIYTYKYRYTCTCICKYTHKYTNRYTNKYTYKYTNKCTYQYKCTQIQQIQTLHIHCKLSLTDYEKLGDVIQGHTPVSSEVLHMWTQKPHRSNTNTHVCNLRLTYMDSRTRRCKLIHGYLDIRTLMKLHM